MIISLVFPFSIIEFLTIVKNMRGFRFFYQWESEGYLSFPGVRGGGEAYSAIILRKFKKFEFSRGIVSEPPTLPPDPNSRSAQAHENNHPEKM